MSNYHAYFDDYAPVPQPSAKIVHTSIDALRAAAVQVVTGFSRWIEQRQALSRISRYSDHLLRDTGFERDWDGSILPRWSSQGDRR